MFSLLLAGSWAGMMSEGAVQPVVDDLGPDLLAETAAMAVSSLTGGEPDELWRGRQRIAQRLGTAASEVVLGLDEERGAGDLGCQREHVEPAQLGEVLRDRI